ncbi:hypothetical protein [Cellvibrio polysaccharolyticus]|uniref:Uncharacterized protein n=1 Tax=Cellvibrio polysaccharolyticus TaxID=2082724 RepID=A0A928V644_9GAMM|nr:hypothetical protein [Cellvibrio polysaccharolyticus]MBE8717576.1 hypothetical protein [Cellvibrio polysaccharolyticus]
MKHLIIALMLVSLFGCKTRPDGEWAKLGAHQLPASDKPLSSLTAHAGDVVVDSWKVQNVPTINIERDINGSANSSKKFAIIPAVKVKTNNLPATIFSGRATLASSDRNYDLYISDKPAVIVHGQNAHHTRGGIAISKYGRPAQPFIVPINLNIAQFIRTNDTVAYTNSPSVDASLKYQGLGKAITYKGMSGGKIEFAYQEYFGSTLQDINAHEFSFDYVPGKEYGYKGAKFIVHEATPTSISITQTAHF